MSKVAAAKSKQNPKLMVRELQGGRISFYLDYYDGRTETPKLDENGNRMYYPEGSPMAGKPMFNVKHIRRKENLNLYCSAKPKTPAEKAQAAEVWRIAEEARNEAEKKILIGMGHTVSHKNDNLMTVFESYYMGYGKKDKRNIKLALNRFKTYLRLHWPELATKKTPSEIQSINDEWQKAHKGVYGRHDINENEYYRYHLKPSQLNKSMVEGFVTYLNENSTGSGAVSAYKRFKKVVAYAVENGYLVSNPCLKVVCKQDNILTKDILTTEEMSQLLSTHYEGENPEIRRAFIFCLYTGIRFCDVKDLRYSNMDYKENVLTFQQSKTSGHSSASWVKMPIREDLLQIVGTPEGSGKSKDDLIFTLPSHTMCLKALRHWTKRAGIDKHITWHCARHSFATTILTGGANVAVVAKLLGHANLKTVEVYVKALDTEKKKAVYSLPQITY